MLWVYLQATILLLMCRRGLRAVPEVVVAHHLCDGLQSESQRITRRYPGYPFCALFAGRADGGPGRL